MKRKLQSIAMQLSESDIQELIRLKKMGDKRVVALQKKRDKLASDLAKVEAQLSKLVGDAEAPRRGRPRKSAGPAKTAGGAKTGARKKAGRTKSKRLNLSAAVREAFSRAGTPLKARDIVDALPAAGIKVKNVSDMRKRVSVVLASQKNHFEQVERGVYQLKD